MVCRRGGFVIQCHDELRDLEAEMLSMVCNGCGNRAGSSGNHWRDFNRGANRAPDASDAPDNSARGFWYILRCPDLPT